MQPVRGTRAGRGAAAGQAGGRGAAVAPARAASPPTPAPAPGQPAAAMERAEKLRPARGVWAEGEPYDSDAVTGPFERARDGDRCGPHLPPRAFAR